MAKFRKIPESAPSSGVDLLKALDRAQEKGEVSRRIKEQIARTKHITAEDLGFRVK